MSSLAAVFPNAVKTFSIRHDRIDDVGADHVNDLQNEVTALERNIGTNAQLFSPNFINSGATNYGSVGVRLQNMQTGTHLPVVRLIRSSLVVPNAIDTYASFDRLNDSYGHYNNVDITIRSVGWWYFSAYVWFPHNDNGYRLIDLEINGQVVSRDTDDNLQINTRDTFLQCNWQGLSDVGDRIRVKLFQSAGCSLTTGAIHLHASMLRGYDPLLF